MLDGMVTGEDGGWLGSCERRLSSGEGLPLENVETQRLAAAGESVIKEEGREGLEIAYIPEGAKKR